MSKIAELRDSLDQVEDLLAEVSGKIKVLSEQEKTFIKQANHIRSKLKQARESQNKKLASALAEAPVTDHAALRYLQRHWGIDIDKLKREIAEGHGPMIDFMKTGTLKTKDGIQLVVNEGVIVTLNVDKEKK